MSNYRDVEPSDQITRLSPGSELRGGNLFSKGDVRIDGKFEGKIETRGKFISGPTAEVKGDVYCMGSEFSGKMDGNIYSGDCITLKGDCSFSGILNVTKLCIEKGATFNGTCKMISKEEFDTVCKEKNGTRDDEKKTGNAKVVEEPDDVQETVLYPSGAKNEKYR
ncbi:MAG: polymer-forming cytoskeletal protein [Bacteroidales bacterium]|nr:polymer-forming cytoskeletal protein [Bacteroidales bacterium]MCI2121881.1 polymer-forming cytoskeletal protein [Bacteroidales bacterium]MCI2145653.1 polymer-forming cytoskeletal protein [Bacteroidales bacterium]